MGGPIEGGWSEAGDISQEQPKRTYITDAEISALTPDITFIQVHEDERDPSALAQRHDVFGVLEPGDQDKILGEVSSEDGDVSDPPGDLQVEVHPKDQGALSKSERKSITDSAKGFADFAKERLLSMLADLAVPGAGRVVDLAFQVRDVVNSVRALFSDDPVLEVPLPSPLPGLGFTLEVPLGSGEDGEAAPPLALCVAPDSTSLTGGWVLDAGEHDDGQAQNPLPEVSKTLPERLHPQQDPLHPPMAVLKGGDAEQSKPRARLRSATTCLVEIDLDSLGLPRGRKRRARILANLAYAYAPQPRGNPGLRRFDLFIIADKGRSCGVWIWLMPNFGHRPPLITPIGRYSQ